jgi:hypothetical protein
MRCHNGGILAGTAALAGQTFVNLPIPLAHGDIGAWLFFLNALKSKVFSTDLECLHKVLH